MAIILALIVFVGIMWAFIALAVTHNWSPVLVLPVALTLALLAGIMTGRALAAETETGIIVLCDTAPQVESVIKHADSKSTAEAIEATNAAVNDPQACVIVAAVYIQGKETSRIANQHGAFGIFAVMVLAVRHPSGMFMPLQIPFEGFAPVRVGAGEQKT